jgi:hypothetical protein
MDINKDKLKIKYILGSYKDSPEYPTTEDLMYQIVNYCYLNNKDNIISDVEICKVLNIETAKDILNLLQKENYIIYEKELKNKINYKIIKNPFI